MKCIKMIQVTKYRWKVISDSGNIILDDLLLASPYHAEEWIKSYISSFAGWKYLLITKEDL